MPHIPGLSDFTTKCDSSAFHPRWMVLLKTILDKYFVFSWKKLNFELYQMIMIFLTYIQNLL